MKKLHLFICIFFICIFTFFVTACSNMKDDDGNVDSIDDYYQYNINDTILSYDVDEDKIYYMTTENNTSIGENGSESKSVSRLILKVMNLDGVLENSYTLPKDVSKFCVSGGCVFYIADYTNKILFFEFDMDTGKSVELGSLSNYNSINKIEEASGKLYFYGINKDYTKIDYSLASVEDRFSYSGERIGCLDLEGGIIEDLPIDLPVSFAKAPDDNLLIYAYDEKGGYYFTIYNTESKSFSERSYQNLEQLTAFDVINENYDFVYLNSQKRDKFILTVSSPYPDGGQKELIQNFPLSAMFNIACFGDFTYCTDLDYKNIIRIQNSAYIRTNKQITMYSVASYSTPFGCGYNINHEVLDDDELALALLSQDPAFDICCINSFDDISANIRDKGSFYPLNDVSGVKEVP